MDKSDKGLKIVVVVLLTFLSLFFIVSNIILISMFFKIQKTLQDNSSNVTSNQQANNKRVNVKTLHRCYVDDYGNLYTIEDDTLVVNSNNKEQINSSNGNKSDENDGSKTQRNGGSSHTSQNANSTNSNQITRGFSTQSSNQNANGFSTQSSNQNTNGFSTQYLNQGSNQFQYLDEDDNDFSDQDQNLNNGTTTTEDSPNNNIPSDGNNNDSIQTDEDTQNDGDEPGTSDNEDTVNIELKKEDENAQVNFDVRNMFPGDMETKQFRLRISHRGNCKLKFHVDMDSDKLKEVLNSKVLLSTYGKVEYEGLVKDMPEFLEWKILKNDKNVDELVYEITIFLDKSVGNDYQSQNAVLVFNWSIEDNYQGEVDQPPLNQEETSNQTSDDEEPVRVGEKDPEEPVNVGEEDTEEPVRVGEKDPEKFIKVREKDPEKSVKVGEKDPEKSVRVGEKDPKKSVNAEGKAPEKPIKEKYPKESYFPITGSVLNNKLYIFIFNILLSIFIVGWLQIKRQNKKRRKQE